MKLLPSWIRSSPDLPWIALFLALSLLVTQYGGMNGLSRTAAMRAVTEGHTLSIDNYREWTIDWARTPDGHYYSNKAPGAALLGLPMFAATDAFVLPFSRHDEKGRAPQPGYIQHVLLMLWLQLLPFSLLVLAACRKLRERGAPEGAVQFFALASLFGNTAALYMSSNFGHGVASLLFLASFLFWWDRRYLLTGLFLSWSLLCDYGVAFALPFVLLGTLRRERSWRCLLEIAAGAIPGALTWAWYHTVCFGSPLRTANQFTNPQQIETLPGRISLWGEFSPFPSPEIVAKLLFGTSRGILFTQPWMLAVFALPFLRREKAQRGLAVLAVGSLAGLLWMNGGFGGWHGGWCLGPRYPSVVYPAMAFALALSWPRIPRWGHGLLWAGLLVSLVFRLLVFPFSNLAPEENLWAYHWNLLLAPDHRGTTILRLLLGLAAVGLALEWQKRRRKFPFSEKPV